MTKPAGRMINQDIALSAKVASLSPEALALFCLLIPHFTAHGKMIANPHSIKGNVCPLIEWLTVEMIEACLVEISQKTNVRWWKDQKGLCWLHSLTWKEHQNLREDRLGEDRLPDYPGLDPQSVQQAEGVAGALPDNSRSNPGAVPPEVEVEVEGEVEGEGGKKPSSDALRLSGLLAELIADNNTSNRSIQPGVRERSVERWARDIDRMLRLDSRSVDEVETVLRWCQKDAFWRGNILSGGKLRDQFDKLVLQIERDGERDSRDKSASSHDIPTRRLY